MDRRKFLKYSALSSVGSAFVPNFLFGLNEKLEGSALRKPKLVVIQLTGGNDGLNTVIPFRNDQYYRSRPTVAIPSNDIIRLDDELGLNPKMEKFSRLFKEGCVSIINSVGYPNQSRSHFASMDIWHSAADVNKQSKTGWIGNYLDVLDKKSHHALEINKQLSGSLKGKNISGMAVQNVGRIQRILHEHDNLLHRSNQFPAGEDNNSFLYQSLININQSADYIKDAHTIKTDNVDFPKTKIGENLSTVSQLIRSGIDTEIYYLSLRGFDSHVNQRKSHDQLLDRYSSAIYHFVESLKKSGHFKDTLILTFSEFGRRVSENGSKGTDHGKGNSVFIIGEHLKQPGIFNDYDDLKRLDNGDIPFKVDFKNIYSDIISEWFKESTKGIISSRYKSLEII